MSFFVAPSEDGSYYLTGGGTAAIIALVVILLAVIAFMRRDKSKDKTSAFSVKQLVFCGAALALAFVTSYIILFRMPLGGNVTLCSMLFIVLIGYMYGPKIGITSGLALGLLIFMQDGGSYILDPLQACLDYIVAFAALGISGFFKDKKNGLLTGYLAAVIARGFFHALGGYIYWMDYMPEDFPASLKFVYPLIYNYSFLLAEAALTMIIISVPAVKKALTRVQVMAVS